MFLLYQEIAESGSLKKVGQCHTSETTLDGFVHHAIATYTFRDHDKRFFMKSEFANRAINVE
jgi:hypothetical protein